MNRGSRRTGCPRHVLRTLRAAHSGWYTYPAGSGG